MSTIDSCNLTQAFVEAKGVSLLLQEHKPYIPEPNTDNLKRSFSYSGASLRNSLPHESLRLSASLQSFKTNFDYFNSLTHFDPVEQYIYSVPSIHVFKSCKNLTIFVLMVLFRVEIKLVCMCVCMYANCFYKKDHYTFNSSYFWQPLFPIVNCVLHLLLLSFF